MLRLSAGASAAAAAAAAAPVGSPVDQADQEQILFQLQVLPPNPATTGFDLLPSLCPRLTRVDLLLSHGERGGSLSHVLVPLPPSRRRGDRDGAVCVLLVTS